ncbi:MAG: hypothetical protein ACJ8AH_14820 [Stellaceae bacterium]
MSDISPFHNEDVAIERRDAPVWLVGILAAGVVAFVVLSSVVLMSVYPGALHGPSDAPRVTSAEPRLQIDPAADLAAYRAAEERQLTGYGWVDKQRGIVRLPIGEAMRDVAAAGIKDWPEDAK